MPVALYAWLRFPSDFRAALESVLNCGGDTDTIGAIVGALVGASADARSIPVEWLEQVWEWPRSANVLRQVARHLAEQKMAGRALGPVHYFWPGLIPRNILFLLAILAHAFRRLWPPLNSSARDAKCRLRRS